MMHRLWEILEKSVVFHERWVHFGKSSVNDFCPYQIIEYEILLYAMVCIEIYLGLV